MTDVPDHELKELEEDFVAACILAYETNGESGVEALLAEQPARAGVVRQRLADLRKVGLLLGPRAPERLQYGEFLVVRRLGAGGMGIVYEAMQASLRRQVALKVVRPEFLVSTTARERFQREVEAVARLHHPGIVPIVAVGTEGEQPWFAMEYVDGLTLDALLESMRSKDPARESGAALRMRFATGDTKTPLAASAFTGRYWETCVRLIHQVAATMSYVHERGIVHRDLKPSNILVTPHGQALIVDFGLAHVRDLQRLTGTEAMIGSPAYMAPEQIRGEAIDERVDVYSLAVTLYEMLALRLPFLGETQTALHHAILAGTCKPLRYHNRSVPRDLEVVCEVALDRDRARRYRTMADFAADLDCVLNKRSIQARPLGIAFRLARAAQRHPAWTIGAAALVMMGLVLPLLLWHQQARANDDLRLVNDRLREKSALAEANYTDALTAVREMLVRTAAGEIKGMPGSEALSLAVFQRAHLLYERMRSRQPGELRVELASVLNMHHLGSLLENGGRADEAKAMLREAVARLEPFDQPDVWLWRGTALVALGGTLHRCGDAPEARAVLDRARCELENAALLAPTDGRIRTQLSHCFSNLVLVHQEAGEVDDAWALVRANVQLTGQLLAENPGALSIVLDHAFACRNRAKGHNERGEIDEAIRWADRGIELLIRHRPPPEQDTEYRRDLAALFEQRGNAHNEARRFDAAEADHGINLALQWDIYASFPNAAHANGLASSLHNLAVDRSKQASGSDEDIASALELQTEAVARAREAVRLAPDDQEFRWRLELCLTNRCGFLSKLDRPEEFGAALAEAASDLRAPDYVLTCARFAITLADQFASRDTDEGFAAAQQWREFAVERIEQAIAAGFRDRAHFEKSRMAKHYNDLREMPTFQAALQKLPPPR